MSETPNQNRRQLWIGILISLVSLAGIFWVIDPREVWGAITKAQPLYLLLSALGIVAFLAIRAVRWRVMLHGTAGWWRIFHIQNIGYLLNAILPLRLGDIGRSVLIGNQPNITVLQGLSTTVVERLLDMLFIVALLPFTLAEVQALPAWMQDGARLSGVLALGAIVGLVVAVNLRPFISRLLTNLLKPFSFLNAKTIVQRIDELLASLSDLTRPKDAAILIGLSVLIWLPVMFAYYATLRAVNLDPSWSTVGFVLCASAFSVALPSSPGQIGVFHLGVTLALAAVGQPAAESASFAFLYHGLNNMLLMSIMGIIGISRTGSTFENIVNAARRFRQAEQPT